ncbi:helix-turn-helix domain-containing protein [Pelagibacteraceae bacterium]|nr:helix-turn-helix domain-containing protein [Pelagibacteraceae bacterium]
MKTKLNVFSKEDLKNFFINLDEFFDTSFKSFVDLEKSYDGKNLSIFFLDNQTSISEKTIKKIKENENFIFVCKDFSVFQKFSLNKKNTFISPISINKLADIVNGFINSRKLTFTNIKLINQLVTNIKTNEKEHLTEAENHILLKLFKEKNIEKKILERDALQIKHDLNTSSMESHLNRIRKKLKKISSHFTISSKDKHVFLEVIN